MLLQLPLNPSKRFTCYLALLYGGAFLCVALSGMPVWLKILSCTICLFTACYAIRKYALLSAANAVITCIRIEKDQWLLKTHAGDDIKAHLLGNTWWSRYLLILNFQTENRNPRKYITVIVLDDMLAHNTFRRMRVYLNVESHA